ncbi:MULTISPECIES: hypothetical protein [Salinicola]|uniref:Uncharacterized protein n=1 Tax=Salinicola endophyticus TaxID=1949083 RepID=A0AB74UGG7_9GAMM|nr:MULTISPECIES: hypothetical protein [unclassified Salinicola]MCE3028567.1 hypothetical protein [Salinicola sp. DM10]WIX33331.1 hypothetical protein QO259_01340 [Salinicola sp. JS01]
MSDGSGASVVLTLRDWAAQYHACAIRHNGLVTTLEETRHATAERPD